MQKSRKNELFYYLAFHLALALGAALLLFWAYLSRLAGTAGLYCPLHQLLHLYCPFCGGTRVLSALPRLDFGAAISANPLVFLLIPLFLFFDLRALIRLLGKEEAPFRLPPLLIPAVLSAFLVYGIIRNLLLLIWGIDPLGDLASYYA